MQNMRIRTIHYTLSLAVAILMAVASLAGLVSPEAFYTTEELARAFLANDMVVLAIGVPMLLGSMWLTRRGSLTGRLLRPGALLFVLYNYTVYLLAMPLNAVYLLDLVLVTLSLYSLIALLADIRAEPVRDRLAGSVHERLAGGVLVVLGALFLFRAAGILAAALISREALPVTDLALLSTDLLFTPAWIMGGILLWKRRAFGYVSGLGLLFQASMLFTGLIVVLALQPLMSDDPFPLVDIIVVLVMGLVCFVPFFLFVRGVLSGNS